MPTWIEFHDSTLVALNRAGADVEILLEAYVHRWETNGKTWQGTGWMQPVRITVSKVVGESVTLGLPIGVSQGRLQLGAVNHDNVLQLPLTASEPTNLRLQLVSAEVLEFAGRAIRVEAAGEARYVEDLPPDLWPGDAG